MELDQDLKNKIHELRPGPYIIYFNPNKKTGYGVYREQRHGNRLEEQGLSKENTKEVEVHTDVEEVSKRERFLQHRDGYRVDPVPYWFNLHRSILAQRPESIKKRVNSCDYEAQHSKVDWIKVHNSYCHKKISSHRQKGVIAIDPEGNRTLYSGQSEASRQLSKKLNRKVLQGAICNVLRENYPAKQYLGYTFEHA